MIKKTTNTKEVQFSGQKYFSDMDSMDVYIEENITTAAPAQGWFCCLCGKTFINKLDVKRHIESKHCTTMGFRLIIASSTMTITSPCSCDVSGCQGGGVKHKTRHSLATHKRLKHGITDRSSALYR